MSYSTEIEWTDGTWNPVTGCTKVSAGCTHCFAETLAGRFWQDRKFTDVRCHHDRLTQPLRWRRPRRIFVNSMSDLFHPAVPAHFIDQVFEIMGACDGRSGRPRHIFQILTKRPELIDEKLYAVTAELPLRYLGGGDYLPNVWLGVSVENQATADARIARLIEIPAAVHFVSAEPLLDHVSFAGYLDKLDWVIVGGESGPGARPCRIEWIRDIVRECKAANVAVFVKQLGGVVYGGDNARIRLRDRKGGDPSEWPEELRVREYPR
jgi:protein gp37